jgi:predicted nuclease of predicted toxin-antitoxin system
LKLALDQKRVLITEDRDFCELIFRDGKKTYGIILVRIPAMHRENKANRITTLVNAFANELIGSMTTLTLQNMKIRPLSISDE